MLTSISAVLYLPLAAIFSPWQWVGYGPFEIQAAFAPQYALYFAFGVAVGVFGLEKGLLDPNGRLVQRWTFCLLCSIASFLLLIIPTALIVKDAGNASIERLAADLSLVVFVCAACFGMMSLSLRYGTARWPVIDQISRKLLMIGADVVRVAVFAALPFATTASGIVALAGMALQDGMQEVRLLPELLRLLLSRMLKTACVF